jgi:uncharacterized protein YjbI with pentapeptide repeats
MADPKLLKLLRKGVPAWNNWREKTSRKRPDLDFHLDLSNTDLDGFKLSHVNLMGAVLRGSRLSLANLIRADLRGTDLCDANLLEADLTGLASSELISVWLISLGLI